jgi:hypothetical protein
MNSTAILLAGLMLAWQGGPRADGSSRGVVLGPPETVLADEALGLRAFPDGCLAVVRTRPDCRVLVAAGVSSVLLDGPQMGRFTRATTVMGRGKPGEFDNGYAGIGAAVRAGSGELLAFYHAEDQEGMAPIGGGIPGFYCSVAMAVSADDGTSFRKAGRVLSGHTPKDPKGSPDQGVGEPCVVADPDGEYLYAYYTSHERRDKRGVDICMARCRAADVSNPGAWRKLHAGAFLEPGLGGIDSPVVTGGRPATDALLPHVVHLAAAREFLMVFCLNAYREGGQAERSGIYAAFSGDGVHWPRERMRQIWRVPVVARDGQEVAWHPTFVPDEGGGTAGWLYYAYSERWGWRPPNRPHYLARRRMTITSTR